MRETAERIERPWPIHKCAEHLGISRQKAQGVVRKLGVPHVDHQDGRPVYLLSQVRAALHMDESGRLGQYWHDRRNVIWPRQTQAWRDARDAGAEVQ